MTFQTVIDVPPVEMDATLRIESYPVRLGDRNATFRFLMRTQQAARTHDEQAASPRGAGNRRGQRTAQAILSATREILAESGVPGLTVEGVAARAGVAKTTIYRRWRSKDELALAVLIDMVEQVVAVPDKGDARAELIAFLNGAVRILRDTLMGRVMQGLVSELAVNPELALAFHERVVAFRITEFGRLIERGVERGDLRPDADHELFHELLFGPVYYRLFLSGEPLDSDLAERIVAAVFPAFTESAAAL